MKQEHSFIHRISRKLIEGRSTKQSILSIPIFLRYIGLNQFHLYSTSTINFLIEHHTYAYYTDSSYVADHKPEKALKFRQYRKTAKSDVFHSSLSGDLAITNVHSELKLRYSKQLKKTRTDERIDSTAIHLSDLSLQSLSQEKKIEILRRMNDYALHQILQVKSGNKDKRTQRHMTLFTTVPHDYTYLKTPLDHFIFFATDMLNRLQINHTRFNFSHDHPPSEDLRYIFLDGGRETRSKCNRCDQQMPSVQNPMSLRTLSAVKIHKRMMTSQLTAYVLPQWCKSLKIPPMLQRHVYDLKLLGEKQKCELHPDQLASYCQYIFCPNHNFYRTFNENEIETEIENYSNSDMKKRQNDIANWPRDCLHEPFKDRGEHHKIAKIYKKDSTRFVDHVVSEALKDKLSLHGQNYSVEIASGRVCLCQDTEIMERLKTRLIAMSRFRTAFDLKMSLTRSEIWVFRPAPNRSKGQMFYKSTVFNKHQKKKINLDSAKEGSFRFPI